MSLLVLFCVRGGQKNSLETCATVLFTFNQQRERISGIMMAIIFPCLVFVTFTKGTFKGF